MRDSSTLRGRRTHQAHLELTAVAAVLAGRHWVGYEVSNEYAGITRTRADAAAAQPRDT